MKKLLVMILCVVALLGTTTSCGSLGSALSSATSSNAAATTLGATTGTALVSLYNNYKSVGKLDLTNTTNLSNALLVVNAYTQLKANEQNQGYRASFATGLVTGGSGMITTATATNIINQLLASAGLQGVNSSNISTTVTTATTLINLFNVLNAQ